MQTTLPTEPLLTERPFQLPTHPRSVSSAGIVRAMHSRQVAERSSLSHPEGPSHVDTLPRDVSSRFGARLRELRRERNLTQFRMASDFGIDRSFISDVERGRKSISLPMLEVIALGMKISLSDLLRDI